jgi:hypothetical protein
MEDAIRKNQLFTRNEESRRWFYERTRRTNINSAQFIREYDQSDMRTTSQIQIGCMYCFLYDPKWKDELPYYDRFPLIFITDTWVDKSGKAHFAGINMHYLPYKQRAALMDALLDLQNNTTILSNKKLLISYGIMKKAATSKWFAPTYKRYLKNHVRSRLVKIPYEEWIIASLMPVAEFSKASQKDVWKDSLKKTKGR